MAENFPEQAAQEDGWTDGNVELLISYYENRHYLWNIACDGYAKVRGKKKEIIVAKLVNDLSPKQDGTAFTVADIMQKWKSLRDTFTKNKRRVDKSKKTGSSRDKVFVPKWQWFARMAFVNASVTARKGRDSFNEDLENIATTSTEEPDVVDNLDWPQDYQQGSDDELETIIDLDSANKLPQRQSVQQVEKSKPLTSKQPSSRNTSGMSNTSSCSSNNLSFSPPPSKRRRVSEESRNKQAMLQKAMAVLESTSNVATDGASHFGKLVATKLRALPTEKQDHAQLQILQVLANVKSRAETGSQELSFFPHIYDPNM